MIALTQIFQKLFPQKEHPVILVQTALETVHEENSAEGSEFLDDLIREEEMPDGETA
ncbi:hypothetical protein [Chitinophaga filiformis]|uniref:Uncharacterized protein n=1 Tax=Chitinophaga filiformis TaxID=104663 RepID=A0A1G7H387_CHIFI|nr:hypothetical protein [Chitinophaga filiformis]SDE94876.1 hypothetical protein SAMN04488121_101287 [Chitinophaga filiformis]